MASAPLAAFLRTRKGLAAHGATHWVLGNEAGDLDSLACAIGFAFLSQYAEPSGPQWVPVVQTPRADLVLRPENLAMLHKCSVDPEALVCVDEMPALGADAVLALVDHNRVSDAFRAAHVAAVVDHHADEGMHTDAGARVVVPPERAGSCASVLTTYFAPRLPPAPPLPPAMADLLLSAVLIDTYNFSPEAGKAQAVDEAARAFLARQSSYPDADAQAALFDALVRAKSDVSGLSVAQKLRRDYKLLECETQGGGVWRIGTSSTVEPLAALVRDGSDALTDALRTFCTERKLDVEVVLAGFHDDAGQAHRELLVYAPDARSPFGEALAAHRAHGVDLAPLAVPGLAASGAWCAAYTQRDARVTRKQFAPAVRAVCAALSK
ncbi:exopolyphosphatase [Malassezia brasiliensis]|uniref:Exopolyphosphatase n=1 Tax=Malassezia brasiliensis TaxID=1821822 RepID=A0AAF0DT59_9BASI|nr:exopolyphosphatase [Malassezia brasiliensis]